VNKKDLIEKLKNEFDKYVLSFALNNTSFN